MVLPHSIVEVWISQINRALALVLRVFEDRVDELEQRLAADLDLGSGDRGHERGHGGLQVHLILARGWGEVEVQRRSAGTGDNTSTRGWGSAGGGGDGSRAGRRGFGGAWEGNVLSLAAMSTSFIDG